MARENLVGRARAFALEAHKETRYGALPYEFHLKAVVAALPAGSSEEVIAAAWLHDTVEDTPATLHEIRTLFGGKVARLVDSVTDEPGETREARKALTYRKLAVAPVEARTLKLADRVANMTASIENPKMKEKYRKEFPEFIRWVGTDPENAELVLKAFWLYLDANETSL